MSAPGRLPNAPVALGPNQPARFYRGGAGIARFRGIPQPSDYVRRIREALPPSLKGASFEVDLASVDPRPQNPFNDPFPVNIYNPVSRSVERSAVAELFARLPIRTTLVRVFTDETTQVEALRAAVERALYRRDSNLAEAVP